MYIWCAAADPADPGVFKSKKYIKVQHNQKNLELKQSKLGGESTSSIQDGNFATNEEKTLGKSGKDTDAKAGESGKVELPNETKRCTALLPFLPCAFVHNCLSSREDSFDQRMSEDGMFYCSLCEVEVCSDFSLSPSFQKVVRGVQVSQFIFQCLYIMNDT